MKAQLTARKQGQQITDVMWHSQPKWCNLIINCSSSWDFSCVSFPPLLLGCQLAALSWEQLWGSFSGQGCVRGPTSQLPASPHACLGSQGGNCWNLSHLRPHCPLTQPTLQPEQLRALPLPPTCKVPNTVSHAFLPLQHLFCDLWPHGNFRQQLHRDGHLWYLV